MPPKNFTRPIQKKIKILLVEDSGADADFIERELKNSGLDFEITVIQSKAEYIKSIEKSPDIILCDHSLPQFNSIDALEILQKNNLKIPFIHVSGAITEEHSIEIIKRGGSDYILKDRLARLPSAILNALDKLRIEKELAEFIEKEIKKENLVNDKTVLSKLDVGTIIDSSPNIIALLDDEGNIIAVNKAWKEFAEENELNDLNYGLGKNYIEVSSKAAGLDKEFGTATAEGIKGIFSDSRIKFSLEYPCDSPFEKRWFRLLVVPLKIGKSNGAIVIHTNISDAKFAEAEVFRSEKKFQTLVENSGDIIALINKKGIIEYVSPSIKILGYEPKELIGQSFVFGMHVDDVEKKEDNFGKLLNDPDTPIHTIHRVQHKDGSYKWLEGVKINRLNDENVRAIVANFRDITERKESEIKLANAYRLYYFISHVNQAIIHNHNEQELFDEVCEIAIKQAKLKMAWIGLADKENGIIKMQAQCGASEGTQEILRSYKYVQGGPLDRVLKGADYAVVNDVQKEYKSAWKNFGKNEQFKSAISLPIKKSGEVVGVYSLYYPEVNYFDEAEINLLTEAAGDISFALDVMEKKRLHEIAEKKVADSEKKYKQLFDQNPLPMWVYDSVEYRFLDVNEAAINHYGYSREEFLSMKVVDLRPEDDKPKFIKAAISSEPIRHLAGQWRHFKKDGSLIDVEVSVDHIIFNGIPARLAVMRDITEKLITEKKIEQSEKTLKAAQAIAHVGSWEIDIARGISIWSEESCRIYGISPKNNIQTWDSWISFVHPDDLDFVLKSINEVEAEMSNISLNFRIIRADGVERYLLSQFQNTFNEFGDIIYVTGVVHDITDRYIAQQEMEFNKNNLSALINSTTNLMWSVDTNFNLITSNFSNDKAVKIIYGKEMRNGMNILSVIEDVNIRNKYKKFYERAFSGEIFTELEYFEAPDPYWLEVSFYPILDDGLVIGTACFAQDVTQRIYAEEEREKLTKDIFQRNKNLEQFAYIISHNLRAPVANIIGFAEELSDDTYNDEEKKLFILEILSGVKRLDDVIKDLNEILHLNKEADTQKEEIFLSQLVYSIKTSIVNLVTDESVEIKTNFQKLKTIFTLKSYLYSIFQNLIINSIKYKRPGVNTVIEISSEIKNGKACITFTDNGMGFDLDKKGNQVFGLYKRFHPEIEGKGMGLFMVKAQVENLGGSIKVRSILNEGTKFEIELPV